MKLIHIPKFFHEIFGKKSTLFELLLVAFCSFGISAFLFNNALPLWRDIGIWKTSIFMILTFDIVAGVIANFTFSTNKHYQENPKSRLIFILIHVQPLLFAFLIRNYFIPSISLWAYTIFSALIVNTLVNHPAQRPIAGTFFTLGLCGFLVFFDSIPMFIIITYLLFMFKVLFSFAVDHYSTRSV